MLCLWFAFDFLYDVVDKFVVRVLRFLIRLGQVFDNFWNAYCEKFVDLFLTHLNNLIRSGFGCATEILMHCLKCRVLLQELNNCIVTRLLPV